MAVSGLTPKQEAFAIEYVRTGSIYSASNSSGLDLQEVPLVDRPYVYFLVRPDTGGIVYVGKGRKHRMFHHVRDVINGRISGLKKFKGIKHLLSRGIEPKPFVFGYFETDGRAIQTERHMIARIGFDRLLNSGAGVRTGNEIACEQAKTLRERLLPKDVWLPWAEASFQDVPSGVSLSRLYDNIVGELDEIIELTQS